MAYALRAILATAHLQLTVTFKRPAFRFAAFIQPLMFVSITYFMFRFADKQDLQVFVVIGSGMAGLWSSIVYSSAGDIDRERSMGTLESLILAPVDFRLVMLGKVLGNGLLGLISMVLSLLYAWLFYGAQLRFSHPGLLLLGIFLVMVSCVAMSLLLAPLFTLSRSSNALMNGLEYPLFMLSGILFPVESLPVWLKPVSFLLAPTWAMRILRQSYQAVPDTAAIWQDSGILIGLTLLYLLLTNWLHRYMERAVRIDGSLGVE